MKNYQHFTQELDDFSKKIEFGNSIDEKDKVLLYEYLNGRASKELEKTHLSKTIKKDPSNKGGKLVLTKIKTTKLYRGINGKCNAFQSDNTSPG